MTQEERDMPQGLRACLSSGNELSPVVTSVDLQRNLLLLSIGEKGLVNRRPGPRRTRLGLRPRRSRAVGQYVNSRLVSLDGDVFAPGSCSLLVIQPGTSMASPQ